MVRAGPECPVFHPTMEDMNGPFEAYIEKIERKASKVGAAKIVPPLSWRPRRAGYGEDLDFRIERCIKQVATGGRGLYRFLLLEQKPMSLKDDFRAIATAPENQPGTEDSWEIERKYWKNIALQPPLYGADVEGSLFDEHTRGWNLRNLDTVLTTVLKSAGAELPGVNSPYLYFGMWKSTFAWHAEDMDLYSVNYLHFGAPKTWFIIPPEYQERFKVVVEGMLPDMFRSCPEFLRHKELLVSTALLDQHQIPVIRVTQKPREFIVNFPGVYHAGFNNGYNCAESVNFATKRWIPAGARADVCQCNPDSVSINMKLFRHLVPAKLLPPELFESSSEEEFGEEVEDDDDDEEGEARSQPVATSGDDGEAEGAVGSGSDSAPSTISIMEQCLVDLASGMRMRLKVTVRVGHLESGEVDLEVLRVLLFKETWVGPPDTPLKLSANDIEKANTPCMSLPRPSKDSLTGAFKAFTVSATAAEDVNPDTDEAIETWLYTSSEEKQIWELPDVSLGEDGGSLWLPGGVVVTFRMDEYAAEACAGGEGEEGEKVPGPGGGNEDAAKPPRGFSLSMVWLMKDGLAAQIDRYYDGDGQLQEVRYTSAVQGEYIGGSM